MSGRGRCSAELALLLIMLPGGFALWFDAAEYKSDTERLLRAGRTSTC
ncbi:hypothetical protein [Actinophytocola sp. NPDC049390]